MRYSGYLFSNNYGWIKAILLELSIVTSDFEGKFFDFDWNVVGVTTAQILVQITFNDPLAVSSTRDFDLLRISVRESGQVMLANIPPQMSPEAFNDLASAVEIGGNVVSTAFGFSFVVNLLFVGSMSEVYGMINAIQIIAYMINMQTFVPANSAKTFEFFLHFAEWEFVDMSELYAWLFPFLTDLQT